MGNWVRVETRFISHPKVLEIGPLGEALWLRGLCYAGEQLTDGFVPASFLKRMADMKALTIAKRLVDVGLWQERDGGYQIHDYLEWQRSREEVADLNSKRAEAGRRGGKQKASNALANARAVKEQTASKTLPDTDTDTDTDTKPDGIPPLVPPSRGESKPKAESKPRPTRIKDDWIPTPAFATWASENDFTAEEIALELPKFKDHHKQKGTLGQDWDAGLRNWMRKAREMEMERQSRAPIPIRAGVATQNSRMSKHEAARAAIEGLRAAAREEA